MKLYIFIFILLFSFKLEAKIVISEVLASNFRGLLDEDNDDSDWIELYNDSDEDVNIGNYRIYDKDNYEEAFILPDTVIKARERIIIFASGNDRYTSDKYWVETTGMGIAPHLKDEVFHFLYLPVSGDFEAEVEVCNIENGENFSACGLMFKKELDTKSPYVSILSNLVRNSYTSLIKKDKNELPIFDQSLIVNKGWSKVKLKREGNDFHIYVLSLNNYTWHLIKKEEFELDSGYLGLAFGATDNYNADRQRFSFKNFKINNEKISLNELNKKDISNSDLNTKYFKKNEIHTNFKLSKNMDKIFLWNNNSELIEHLEYPEQYTNISYSRIDSSFYYTETSPLKYNFLGLSYIIKPPKKDNKSKISERNVVYNLDYQQKNTENEEIELRYTLDASEPTPLSYNYKNSIQIDSSNVVRVKSFNKEQSSLEETVFFSFSQEKSKLPIVSLVINKEDLIGNEGILKLENYELDIEVPGHVTYLDSKNDIEYSSKCGVKLHGKASKYESQKSFRLYARDLYFNDDFDLYFWDYENKMKSEVFILKNGGQDGKFTYLRDHFGQILGKYFFKNIYSIEFRPVITYLNGEFYGIHQLKERFDERYLSRKFDLSKSSINIFSEEVYPVSGKADSFLDFKNSYLLSDTIEIDFIDNFNNNFDYINLFEYTILRGYSNDQDWPISNQYIWNSSEYDSKWRWVSNDFDFAFNLPYSNSYPKKNIYEQIWNSESNYSLILKKLFSIEEYKYIYANLLADNLNYNLNFKSTNKILDSLSNLIVEDSPRVNELFENYHINFNEEIQRIKYFLEKRPDYFFQHTAEEFGQSGITSLTFTQNYENAGVFHINSLNITEKEWNGRYFNEIPIKVSVSSNPGYRFIGWQNFETGDSVLTDILPKEYEKFEAIFEKTDIAPEPYKKKIVINEIMYKPYEFMDCGDWIELYNSGNRDIDLSNWSFRDDNFQHVYNVLEGVTLKAGEFLIIAQDPMKFRSYYGVAKNVIGGFEFGLGGDDEIRIYNESNQIVDEVRYRNNLPWDEFADGTGYSLELIHPDLDNSLPESWRASYNYGGSSLAHNTVLELENNQNKVEISVFPNPFNEFVSIQNNGNNVNLEIYNVLGEKLLKIENIQSYYKLDLSSYNSGVYYFVFKDFKGELVRTLNIIKN